MLLPLFIKELLNFDFKRKNVMIRYTVLDQLSNYTMLFQYVKKYYFNVSFISMKEYQ